MDEYQGPLSAKGVVFWVAGKFETYPGNRLLDSSSVLDNLTTRAQIC
jgi:hypothetical protein